MSKKYITLPRADLKIKRPFYYYLLFFLPKKQRPDFTKEPLEIKELHWRDDFIPEEMIANEPMFSNISPVVTLKNNWFHNVQEYQIIASLEFARRYPSHEYSKKIRKKDP